MDLLIGRIRTIVSESMYYSQYKPSKLYNHLFTNENADYIRDNLDSKGLAAFIAEGAILPRRDDDLAPMIDALPFSGDESLKVTFDVPNGDPVTGIGIPKGFTVVTGSSRGGKSTLLDAIYAGVYNHIPGDGREYVITSKDAAYVIAEPDRPADSVDISMFVGSIPEFEDTSASKKEFVSSPMSELVSISEAVEMGSGLILMDEEYSNPCVIRRGFLAEDDAIVPISDLGRSMAEAGVSIILISGDESVARSADNVLIVDGPEMSVAEVDKVSRDAVYRRPADRCPVSRGMVFEKGHRDVNVTAQDIRTVEIGEFKVHVPVAALFDISQTSTVADVIAVMKDMMDGSRTMLETCRAAIEAVRAEDDSPDASSGMHHVHIRPMEVAAILNRHPQMLAIQKRDA
jgi:predicted ABC-class ATPase